MNRSLRALICNIKYDGPAVELRAVIDDLYHDPVAREQIVMLLDDRDLAGTAVYIMHELPDSMLSPKMKNGIRRACDGGWLQPHENRMAAELLESGGASFQP